MGGMDEMWGGSLDGQKKATKVKKSKKVEDTSAGFRIQLGTCKRRGKDGSTVEAPILLAKDPLCWILRIGSNQTYPTSLAGVFETIAQQEALELNSESTIEDLIGHAHTTEARIREMGKILDKRIREFIVKQAKAD